MPPSSFRTAKKSGSFREVRRVPEHRLEADLLVEGVRVVQGFSTSSPLP